MARKSRWQLIFEELLAQLERDCKKFRATHPTPEHVDWPSRHRGFVDGLYWARDLFKGGAQEMSKGRDMSMTKKGRE